MCKFFNSCEGSLHLGVCKLAKYVRTALFSGKIYTSDKNFTRPPVATVETNSKSVNNDQLSIGVLTLMIYQHKEYERALIGMTDEAIECEDNKIEAGVGLGIT